MSDITVGEGWLVALGVAEGDRSKPVLVAVT